jgi:CheY-like chemotaxis protein
VGFSSRAGSGSRFWVELPFPLADEKLITAPTLPSSTARDALAGMTVLVVDDSEINLEVAKRILESCGAGVALATDGREAVDYLRDHAAHCDLVLMDIHMPVMDGMTATRMIRQDLGLAELPIVALTAGALASQRQEARFAGMNDFIVKPFQPAEVIDCITRLVKGVRAAQPALPAAEAAETADPMGDWPEIEGIHTPDVRQRLDGDHSLFLSLLGMLLKDHPALPLPGVGGEDMPTMAARLHKLRGSAGNVGASAVAATATLAETACRHGDLQTATGHVIRLNEQLAALAAAAGPALRAAAVTGHARAVDAEGRVNTGAGGAAGDAHVEGTSTGGAGTAGAGAGAPSEFAALTQLLLDQQAEALRSFDALSDRLRAALGDERFAHAQSLVDDLRLAEAGALMNEWLRPPAGAATAMETPVQSSP